MTTKLIDYLPPPADLKARGRQLWIRVFKDYDLGSHELTILAAACRQADELARLERALARAPTLVVGSHGQVKAHPLFDQTRNHRAVLSRLLAQLGFDDADSATARSSLGRKLARARWGAPRVV